MPLFFYLPALKSMLRDSGGEVLGVVCFFYKALGAVLFILCRALCMMASVDGVYALSMGLLFRSPSPHSLCGDAWMSGGTKTEMGDGGGRWEVVGFLFPRIPELSEGN